MRRTELQAVLADAPAFVAVVKYKSFAAAARELGVASSVLSRQVTRLERTLSARLLERNTRSLRLTDTGALVLERIERMLGLANEVATLAEAGTLAASGTVRIGAPRALGRQIVHPLLLGFLERHPEVAVEFVVTDRRIDPVPDRLDLVFSITREPVEGLVARRLLRVRQVLCASPAYLAARGTPATPDDLALHDCVRLGDTPQDSSWRLQRGADTVAVGVAGRYSTNHALLRLDAAVRGLGIASLPDFTVRDALHGGLVVPVLPDWHPLGPFEGHVQLQYPASRMMPRRTRALIEHLVAALGADDE